MHTYNMSHTHTYIHTHVWPHTIWPGYFGVFNTELLHSDLEIVA